MTGEYTDKCIVVTCCVCMSCFKTHIGVSKSIRIIKSCIVTQEGVLVTGYVSVSCTITQSNIIII